LKIIESDNRVVYTVSSCIDTIHAFTTRIGGISKGIYESLNLACRSGDDPENVKENYVRLCNALKIMPEDIVCSNQVHGTNVRVVDRSDCGMLFKQNVFNADAMITQIPGVALMVFTADCVPVLLYDPVKKAVGAVHAGWRSTVADIAGITVRKMADEFGCVPGDIRAAIGPCISKCCFETDNDVADALKEKLPEYAEECIGRRGNKFLVDLKIANRFLLKKTGVNDIMISNECTSCSDDKYWSHRKTGGQRGSQAGIIQLKVEN